MTAGEQPSTHLTNPRTDNRVLAVALLASITLAVTVLKYGISWHPEWLRLRDAAVHWPDLASSTLITAGDRSLLSNITLSAVAGMIGAISVPAYFALSAGAAGVAILLPFAMRWRSESFARLAFVTIAGGALAPVLLAWVGGYDAIVAIAAIVAGLSRRLWLSTLGWLLLGFSHSAVAVAAVLLWMPIMWVVDWRSPRDRWHRALSALVAVAAGWLAIRSLTDMWGGSTDRLALFRAIDPSAIASSYLSAAPLVIFGALGVGWLLFLDGRVWAHRSSRRMLVVALCASVILPLVAVDQTRIVALSLVAGTMTWLDDITNRTESGQADGTVWRTWAVAAVIVPVPVVWMGAVLYPGWGTIDDWIALLGS